MIKQLAMALSLSVGLCGQVAADLIYAINNQNNTIVRFTEDGQGTVFASTGLANPQQAVFDASGYLLVVNKSTNSVRKFSPTGVDLGNIISTGLNNPIGLAIDHQGNIFVSNAGGNYIQKFDTLGQSTLFAGPTTAPYGLAIDGNDNLYVARTSENAIYKYSPTGVESVFSNSGLNAPTAMVFDAFGNMFVSNQGGNYIQKILPNGSSSMFAGPMPAPLGMAFDSQGNLIVAQYSANRLVKFSSTGTDLGIFADSPLSSPQFLIGISSVPEPSTGGMLLISLVALIRRNRSAVLPA